MVVAGAAGGVGRATAELAARAGWSLLLADRDDRVGEVAEGLAAAARVEARAMVGDIADQGFCAVLGEEAGPLGVRAAVVAAAVVQEQVPALELGLDEWERVMAINARAPFLLTRELAPPIATAGGGGIVFFSSIAVRAGRRLGAAYTASKGAVEALTRVLALELAETGVPVNAVSPGFVDTPMAAAGMRWRAERTGVPLERIRAERAATIPLGRLAAPHELAECAAFLASPAAGYVTGAVLEADGGALLGF